VRIHQAGRNTLERVRGLRRKHWLIASTALVVVVAGIGGGAAAATVNVSPAVSIHGTTKICGKDEHVDTVERVDIRNNNFRGEPMCLTVYYHKPNFQITYSGLNEPWAAYPNAFVGCEISVCSPHSGLPMQVSNIRQAYSTWHYHPGGTWTGNAAYDIWFDPKPITSGQVNHGAEIMIWLNQSNIGAPYGTPVYIDGTWWDFDTWTARHGSLSWHYVRFWRQHPTLKVTNLNLKNFFQYTEHAHLLSSTWYLTAVESGYELWHGGLGMHTLWYSVLVTPWHAPEAPKPVTTVKPTPKPSPTVTSTPKPTPSPSNTPTPTATAPASTAPASTQPTPTPTQPTDTPTTSSAPSPSDSPGDTATPTPTPASS
jgi:Glycosyl hydrolase family 12